jgi:hypothetical protein
MNTDNQLGEYLRLCEEGRRLAHLVSQAAGRVADRDLRTRVSTGLALKMYSAFEAVVRDSSARSECAMHHLKTMIETFIYLSWVMEDPGETRARLVFAQSIEQKINYAKNNPDRVRPTYTEQMETILRDITATIPAEWAEHKKGRRDRIF